MRILLYWKNWFRKKPFFIVKRTVSPSNLKKPKTAHLLDFFECAKKYQFIMDLLVKKNLCAPHTFVWMDHEKGSKGFLISILKFLQIQGYYKNNRKLTACQIRQICENSFGVDVSISHVDHVHLSDLNVSFIPLASAIKQEK